MNEDESALKPQSELNVNPYTFNGNCEGDTDIALKDKSDFNINPLDLDDMLSGVEAEKTA